MKILAIETSCDETAIALVEAKGNPLSKSRSANWRSGWRIKILKNLVASQIKIHRPFGGVVPTLAKREHQKNLPILLKKIQDLRFKIQDINLIAVTVGPGLEPTLWTGINFTQELYKKLKTQNPKLRLVGANHLEGHLYSFLLSQKTGIANYQLPITNIFPAVALIASGGHTILLLMKSLTQWKKMGETKDDAAGEAFDKVARLLRLPYPGGPEIEKAAKKGNSQAINFPRPMLDQKNYDFSFSGLKTAVLYYLRDAKFKNTNDVAASFQQAAIDVLIEKTIRLAKEYKAKSIFLSGGVAANKTLVKNLKIKAENLGLKFFAPDREFVTDNAAMIAISSYIDIFNKKRKPLKIEAQPDLSI